MTDSSHTFPRQIVSYYSSININNKKHPFKFYSHNILATYMVWSKPRCEDMLNNQNTLSATNSNLRKSNKLKYFVQTVPFLIAKSRLVTNTGNNHSHLTLYKIITSCLNMMGHAHNILAQHSYIIPTCCFL